MPVKWIIFLRYISHLFVADQSIAEMAGVVGRKISAASARSHTRKSKPKSSSSRFPLGIFNTISLILFVGILAWAYQTIQPPAPRICGSPGGPPITAPRIKLSDGRHLAYKEHGVPKEKANYKFIFIHGLNGCRHVFTFLPQKLVEELGIYVVSYDRSGYGESDPNPSRTVKSTALDIEELADQLGLGPKFYVMGHSLGGQAIWSCLKYIPHRLLGANLLTPAINYWWPGFPPNLSNVVFNKLLVQDQWAFRVYHYLPWLSHWWNTQKWFPGSAVTVGDPRNFPQPDTDIITKFIARKGFQVHARQQGEFESTHRDMMIGFGKWEFDPMDLENPFPNGEGSVHLWQGDQDLLVPVALQRYIVQKLSWIKYHELNDTGHIFPYADGMDETMFRVFLLGK